MSFVRWFIGEPSPDRWIGITCLAVLSFTAAFILTCVVAAVA